MFLAARGTDIRDPKCGASVHAAQLSSVWTARAQGHQASGLPHSLVLQMQGAMSRRVQFVAFMPRKISG